MATAGALVVGTGAVTAPSFHLLGTSHFGPGASGMAVNCLGEGTDVVLPSISTRLSTLKQALGLSMSELGRILGVTRQAVYNWQRGGAIDNANEQRLQEVISALEPHVELFRTRPGGVGSRAIDGQRTLIEALAEGTPPADAFSRLAAILNAEDQQTQRLSALLRNRQTEPGADDVDALG
jgi:transcriptional regulator with XRE-family HTH domain